jgi:hypothetical protein
MPKVGCPDKRSRRVLGGNSAGEEDYLGNLFVGEKLFSSSKQEFFNHCSFRGVFIIISA